MCSLEDGPAAVRLAERASIQFIACRAPLAARQTRSGVTGYYQIDSGHRWRWSAAAEVAVVFTVLRAGAIEGGGASL